MKTMKPFILVLSIFSLLLMNKYTYGQITPLPYYENFDNSANLRWTTYSFGTVDADDFPWYITIHNPYSPAFSMMHTCNSSTTQANNWAVCQKQFSFTAGGRIDSIRTWISSVHPPAIGDTIGIYLLSGNPDPSLATSKILLQDFRGPNFQTDIWAKTTNIPIPPSPGKSYIAFRYKTANNCINIFLDNMHLSGSGPTGITERFKAGKDFKAVPNPVVNTLTIQSKQQFETVHIYDVVGQKVHTQTFARQIDISFLSPGIYFLELIDHNKNRGIEKIVKQ
ncbi:hypothetical protein DBR32_15570 [Taibaiella sp. KBW10]|uniref:T9SS type A sorting domain-containing protein n=1 Tax=Taibaiella sp. KBW10 TaxID=2153357 RepID=UPI000F59C289|nr:T9SS type A sorting domain-containing protein [Taibaiella sp. KBW10]RQO29676.1 hypothetical protein DBR32_15570 [Taibaiella sp. KBW10]